MIDRETALSWAKEAGFPNSCEFVLCDWQEEFQAIITRAQSEAFEQAAKICETSYHTQPACQLIRALKEQQ